MPRSYSVEFCGKEKLYLPIPGLPKRGVNQLFACAVQHPDLHPAIERYARLAMREYEYYENFADEFCAMPGTFAVFALGLEGEQWAPLVAEYLDLCDDEHSSLQEKFLHALIRKFGCQTWTLGVLVRGAVSYTHLDPKLNTQQDIEELIDWCKKGISLPQFTECFRERTENWWETFAEMEAELRQMMDEDKDHTRGAELVAQMEGALNLVFDEISFEMGFNGEKHELILTPEGDKVKLFELIYFQKHAPQEVLEHWHILVGRQRCV